MTGSMRHSVHQALEGVTPFDFVEADAAAVTAGTIRRLPPPRQQRPVRYSANTHNDCEAVRQTLDDSTPPPIRTKLQLSMPLWRSSCMRKTTWTPSIVPGGDDQTVYLVAEDFGKLGRAWREADYEATDLETVIEDLLSGQYNNPIRDVAFNTEERWSEDVSEDVAHELRRRCDLQARDVPSTIQDFVERHEGYAWRQLTLRLV